MNLTIKQNNQVTEQVTSGVIDKLYNLTKEDVVNGITAIATVLSGGLKGRIEASAAYEDAVTYLNTKFGPNLIVSALSYYIRFADPKVESVLKTALNKAEDEGITITEAAATNLENIFTNNTEIVSFDEFKYFIRPNTAVNFSGCSNLERIDITNCTIIPNFSNCSSLAYFNGPNSVQGVATIPDGITSISNRWTECYGVTELHFPDSLNTIGQSAFETMSNLSKVYFGSGITTISSDAFYNDTALTEVHIPDLDTWLDINFVISNEEMSNPLKFAHHLYVNGTEVTSVDFTGRTSVGTSVLIGGSSITSVVLPSTITLIGSRAFRDCTNLVIPDLNLPNLTSLGTYAFSGTKVQTISDLGSITNIPDSCFNNCSQLTSINMPSSLISIGKDAFSGSGLTSFTIPSSVMSIGEHAFYQCKGLTSINIPNTVTSWGQKTFEGCSNLTQVTLTPGLTTLAKYMFQSCTGLTSIVIPNSVTYINEGTFISCTSLVSVTLPNNITEIPWASFERTAIASLTIPSTVTSIGSRALNGVHNLQTLTIKATTPPTLEGTNSLAGFNNNLVIYVPAGSVSAYQAAWPNFASRIQAIQT